MATPSAPRPHSGSTPKNTSISTPTPMLPSPSPRPPTSAPMARNLSHKSPAMKTPASGQAYTHNLSGSSHPPSTPLAAPAFGEDPLNFNSPTAIMMSSLGSHGFTPLPSGGDGLGISTDLNAVTNGAASALGSRNPDEEKSARIQEVIKLLRTSTAGRGIYREGVERLAQLAGFTHMWQGDTLAIAGTCVDLEITFDAIEKDKTTDVVLKINFTAESEEHKKDASEVLKVNLAPSTESGNQLPWHNLESFAINLEYLGRMDRLSQGINCFEAIDGLYLSFRKIWEQEKQSMGQARELDRLSQGRLGRPLLNRNEKIGLCLEYWAERRRALVTTLSRTTDDTMQIFQAESSNERNDRIVGTWAASINCEAGYPSLRVSKDWIEESSFDAVQSGDGAVDETLKPEISWAEPPPFLVPPVESTNKSNAIDLEDPDIKMANPPQVRFVVNLEPPVLLPYSHISTISNGPGISVAFDDTSKPTTYDQAIRNLGVNMPETRDNGLALPTHRRNKFFCTFDEDRKAVSHHHAYTLYSLPPLWCYAVTTLSFDHPKRLADLFPTLRQYVLLWTLLRSIFSVESDTDLGREAKMPTENGTGSNDAEKTHKDRRRGIIKKSNIDPRRAKVEKILFEAQLGDLLSMGTSNDNVTVGNRKYSTLLPVDVSLSLTSSVPPRPKLDLIWPLQFKKSPGSLPSRASFGSVTIEVGPDGMIYIPSTSGIPWAETEKGRRGIARVLELGEDLSLLIEWIMDKLPG